ncbi:FAD:protein FMN transferase [Cryobacterium sp. 5I3]|uniref:FAD:protein FMN transferase n=1 Tax=Cryobacterium sp. 5I3 TaxID=3048592 RepID=UPI002B22CC50|nr:FAD:protein FMN transferase [Cryobacterium sp. 5I3]MEB0202042.1 FAD:protein FMN transferase [Cryobacterium sp. 5I3]
MDAQTFETMGTVVSLRIGSTAGGGAMRDGGLGDGGTRAVTEAAAPDAALAAVRTVFTRWDERFSLYRPDSEISRIARGDIRLTQASAELRDCYAIALDWRDRTDGVFTPHRADGVLDLSGVVKSLAIAEAGEALRGLGLSEWSVNAGGDLLVSGDQSPGQDWVAGIVDPASRHELLASVPLVAPVRAVATSGSAERGEHIWTSAGGGPSPYRQVSVIGLDIVTVDVLATTIIAGGEAALGRSIETFPIEVLAVLRDGSLVATAGLRSGQS